DAGKNIPAADASTGEQKALLIRLVRAHAGLIKAMTGFAPLLLLDEVVAHLDPGRRANERRAPCAQGSIHRWGGNPANLGTIALAWLLPKAGGSPLGGPQWQN